MRSASRAVECDFDGDDHFASAVVHPHWSTATGGMSYASSWPDPLPLFVEVAYKIDANGKIGDPVEGSSGAFIDCTTIEYIEFLPSPDQDTSGTIEPTEETS